LETPNNKHNHGAHRDFFVLNHRSSKKHHLDMFKVFGAVLAYGVLSTQAIPINMAPVFWKQVTCFDLDDV